MAVSFSEVNDSPHFMVGPRGEMGGRREFKIAWGDIEAFAAELLYDGIFGLPAQFPTFPALRVSNIDVKPWQIKHNITGLVDHQTQNAKHDFAHVTVDYAPGNLDSIDPDLPDGIWAEYDQQFSGEMIEVAGQYLVWETDSVRLPADVHPTVRVPYVDHVIKWHRVSAPPWKTIADLQGMVNSNEWEIPATHLNVWEESLLFMGASSQVSYDIRDTRQSFTLTYTFRHKAHKYLNTTAGSEGGVRNPAAVGSPVVHGWNYVLRPNGVWDRPLHKDTNDPMYDSADFSDLFALDVLFL